MVELKTLIQNKDELDVDKINEFINSIPDARVVLLHSSLSDDVCVLHFGDELINALPIPFILFRTSGSVTNEGFFDESIIVCVLCGEFEVEIRKESIDFSNPAGVAEKLAKDLTEPGSMLVFTANSYKNHVYLDHILRVLASKFPNTQFWGGNSTPSHFVITNVGLGNQDIVVVALNGVSTSYELMSGFKIDSDKNEKYVLTKTDEYSIYEIDGENAVDKYSGLQQIRPYFLDSLVNLVERPGIMNVAEKMSKTSKLLYDGIVKTFVRFLGFEVKPGVIEPLFAGVMDSDRFRSSGHRKTGTVLHWTTNKLEDQLQVYDKVVGKFKENNFTLIMVCALIPFFIDFQYNEIKKRLDKLGKPYILSFMYGEIGAYKPHTDVEDNLVHGGTIQVLGFK